MSIVLKVGRNILYISENDLILDNGACYQIISQPIMRGFDTTIPRMSKKLFADLKKRELIFTNEKLKATAMKRHEKKFMTYYKFNIERMKSMGYLEI